MSSASCRNAPAHLVQRRFRTNDRTGGPINLLDMQSTVDPGTPSFLGGENCSLLRHMRRVALGGGSANRMSGSVSALAGWKDIESWLLIAQAGALTLPHQDPHGLDTWLRVLQGEVGVGWLADPTEQAMESFYEDPNALADCQDYRFVILRPGQVMFLPGGTVHFVFRRSAPAADTCMHGGHILRWSAVATFARVTELQLASPDSTNEDITVWAGVYMSAASRLIGSEEPGVRQRLMTADGVSEFNRVYRRVKRTYEKL